MVGKTFIFGKTFNLTVNMLKRLRGDHICTFRYRLVDWEQAKRERDDGDVLIATNKVKTLDFKVPKGFTRETMLRYIEERGDGSLVSDDDYFPVVFPIWASKLTTPSDPEPCL